MLELFADAAVAKRTLGINSLENTTETLKELLSSSFLRQYLFRKCT